MTPEQQLELVKKHYAYNSAGDHAAAEALLSDDFVISTPTNMPFGGTFHGKHAFRELIPLVANSVGLAKLEFVATTVGDDFVVELCDFTLEGQSGPPLRVAEVIRFSGDKISEITPYYYDPRPWIEAAERRRDVANH